MGGGWGGVFHLEKNRGIIMKMKALQMEGGKTLGENYLIYIYIYVSSSLRDDLIF